MVTTVEELFAIEGRSVWITLAKVGGEYGAPRFDWEVTATGRIVASGEDYDLEAALRAAHVAAREAEDNSEEVK